MIAFSTNELVWRCGWMLLHSLWQIALIGLLLWAALRLTQHRSAKLRYGIACGGLALCYLPLVYTFAQTEIKPEVVSPKSLLPRPATLEAGLDDVTPGTPLIPAMETNQGVYYSLSDHDSAVSTEPGVMSFQVIESKQEASLLRQLEEFIGPWIIWLTGFWLAGVCLFAIWNAGGWLLVQRLRRQGIPLSSGQIAHTASLLRERLQIRRNVTFLESLVVEVPVVIGWLKPVILLPAGLLTSLTPEQVEAVIAHELAHIRRYDYLINLLQTLTESLLFYHPVVWWLSHRIRVEREYCCDDEAVAVSGDRNRYVSALAAVETARLASAHALSLAGSYDGSTLSRIRRLRGVSQPGSQGWIAGLTTITLLLAVGLAVGFSQKPEPPASAPVSEDSKQTEVQQQQASAEPQQNKLALDPESFRLDLTYYGEQDKPYYQFSLGRNVEDTKKHGFHLVEPTDHWEKADYEKLFQWLRRSGYFQTAQQIDLEEPPVPTSRAYLLRVASEGKVWEEDLGFDIGMLLRLKSLQRVLAGLDLKSAQVPDAPIGLQLLLSRLSGYERIWMEGQPVNDLKLNVSSKGNRFIAGTPVPIKLELTNTGKLPQEYEKHILSLVPSSIYLFDEHGRRVPYVGGTSQIQSHQETLRPGETVLLDEFDLAQFNYLRQAGQHGANQPGRYFMYAVHGNGIRSNGFQFEITRNIEAEPDFVGRLLPLVHDDWILVANPNFKGEIHPGKNFTKVAGFPARFQCSPTGSIRDVSHVWLYLTKTRAEALETSIEQHFLPETSYLGQIGTHHLYVHVDEKSQQRWPDVLDQFRAAIKKHTDEEEFSEVYQDFKRLMRQEPEAMEKVKRDPITRLIDQLVDAHGLWLNGVYPDLKLPESSTPREVLAEAIKWHGFDKGHIEKYKVLEVRQGIKIEAGVPLPEFSAVRLESDQGNKILLMYFESGTKTWWTRFYDTPEVEAETIEWGEADKGTQVSLSSTKAEWAQNETPTLKLTVRNTNEKSVSFIPHIGVCRVEYDGTWYVWGTPVAWGGRAVVVEPGQTADSEIPLNLSHDDANAWITEGGRKPLVLNTGKHTIRVSLQFNEGQTPHSQPLELTITAAAKPETSE